MPPPSTENATTAAFFFENLLDEFIIEFRQLRHDSSDPIEAVASGASAVMMWESTAEFGYGAALAATAFMRLAELADLAEAEKDTS